MAEWLVILYRTVGLFILLLLVIPFFGRRPLSGMTTFDYIAGMVTAGMIALIALNLIPNAMVG
ncbi:hypothetical protein [Caldalkalibacillus mannanilyticus]|uniref:hypothetical protein n=1 Tax=Caldalkalibacillus mannanilyticus TaxID=1418 RepID=UPI0006846734|nr:hypothetical protein [Caldalkalibacillus mannanilyticus]